MIPWRWLQGSRRAEPAPTPGHDWAAIEREVEEWVGYPVTLTPLDDGTVVAAPDVRVTAHYAGLTERAIVKTIVRRLNQAL